MSFRPVGVGGSNGSAWRNLWPRSICACFLHALLERRNLSSGSICGRFLHALLERRDGSPRSICENFPNALVERGQVVPQSRGLGAIGGVACLWESRDAYCMQACFVRSTLFSLDRASVEILL